MTPNDRKRIEELREGIRASRLDPGYVKLTPPAMTIPDAFDVLLVYCEELERLIVQLRAHAGP